MPVAFKVVGHRNGLTLEIAGILQNIGLRDTDRRADDRLRAQREPAVEADIQRDAGENRDQNGRRDRDDRKQRDDAHVKPGGSAALATRAQQSENFANDEIDQPDHEKAVDRGAGDEDVALQADRRQPKQNEKRQGRADQCADRQHEARQGKGRAAVLCRHSLICAQRQGHCVHHVKTFPKPVSVGTGNSHSHSGSRY
ncbi:hypothetical protein D3C87_1595820 [compost metagenome]